MGILWALIVGLVVGALAKLLMPGRDGGGIVMTALLGVAGSMLAFVVGRALGLYRAADDAPGIIAAVIGAVGVLAAYRAIAARRLT